MLTRLHPELAELLTESSASEPFKSDVARFVETGNADRLEIRGFAPRVKVTRVLTHVLANHPDLDIERVAVEARSGCSDFVGILEVATGSETKVFSFVWCCRWRAEQEGWTDYYGFPDQTRAAREYDWRCMQVWEEQ